MKVLKNLEVEVKLGSMVKDYDGENIQVLTENGEKIIQSGTLIWTAGVKGNMLKGVDEKSIVSGNRFKVNEYSQIDGLDCVFAIGDLAAMISDKRPKGHPMVAQVAIQQGKALAKNLYSMVKAGSFEAPFQYVDKGSMATIGKKDAVADLKIAFLDGRIGWLLWSFIHLISITGFRNKFKVGFNWMMKYFTYEKANDSNLLRVV